MEHATAQGWRVGEIFTDNGVSGVRDDRPGLDGLLDCLCKGRASVVIAEDGVRFSRDPDKLATYIGWCEAQGVAISYARADGSSEGVMERLFQEGIAERRQQVSGRASA